MREPPRSKGPAWLLLVAIVGASAAIWALAPMSKRQQADPDAETAGAASATPSAEADLSRLRRAMEVLSRSHADQDGAQRRQAMGDLLARGDLPTKLTFLLEAAAADPTPPDQDPLWVDLVRGLSSTWRGDGISSGMDLMFTESRPRARDAVVSSFASLALERTGELTPEQRQKLTEHFIDIHNHLPAFQQREVEAATRQLGGNDVADLMQGKGMGSDDDLEVQREYKRSLEDSQRMPSR